MKFGISLPNNQGVKSIRDLIKLAKDAEAMGYNSVWVSEHLFHASYVAERLGTSPYHEAMMILAAVAPATTKVRLGTSVLVLPWHHPARLAKQVASLDELSDGRVDLGIGVAQTPDEFANLNVPYSERGAITDDSIDAMRVLWEQDVPAYSGKYFSFEGLRFEPKPVQSPLPILVGGNSDRALRRVREKGQGWHAMVLSPDEIKEKASLVDNKPISIRQMLAIVDEPWERPVGQRRTMKGTVEELRELVSAYADAGMDEIVIDSNTRDLDATRSIYDRFLNEIAAHSV
ncbi:MAG: TIGR03619 family F420-dependent LLM class oxidoreductase [Pseudomonadota bacterium]